MDIFKLLASFSLPAPRSIMQIGASFGQEIDLFASNGISHGLFIEPLPFAFEILKEKCSQYPGYICVNQLAGKMDGEDHTFHVASNGGQSSSILRPKNHKSIFPTVTFDTEVAAQAFTIDTISVWVRQSETTLPEFYDLIYIDVQGAELEVFKGAVRNIQKSKYIFSELGFGGGYESDVSYLHLSYFLESFGYKLVSLQIDPRSGYGDGLFVNTKLVGFNNG
jgi:FkbM family methyltransferase